MIEPPPRSAPSVRRAAVRLVAAGFAALLLGALAGPATSAGATLIVSASTPTPSPTPTESLVPGDAVLTLAPVGRGILNPGESLAVSVTMTNDTFTATAGGTLSLAFGGSPLSSRADLDAWLAGDARVAEVEGVAASPFLAVEAGSSRTTGVIVEEGHPAFAALGPGVYPIVATLSTAGESFSSTSVVVVPDTSSTEVGLGVVVPITAGATAEGLLTSEQLEELTDPLGSLTAQLDAVEATEAILAVDPAVPAAIRVLGSAAPESALLWLARLEVLPNTRFALQFGDADVASQVQAGIVPPLVPTTLQSYMDPANFAPVEVEAEPTATPTPTPTPTVDPAAPVYPDLPTLLDIGVARADTFWPETGTAGADVVDALGEVSVDDQQAVTLVASTTTVAGSAGDAVPARGDVGEAPVLVYDAAVSRELEEASVREDSSLRGADIAAAMGYFAFAVDETGGAPLLVTVDRAENRSRVALRAAVTAALEAPSAVPYTLGALAGAPAEPVEIVEIEPDAARVAAASALVADEEALAQFATILDDPSQIAGPERAELLQLLGEAWRLQPDAWGLALAAHRTGSATTLDSVGILRASPIQLITSGAVIPVWVRNDLPYAANVTLLASPDDLRLDVQETTRVVAQPQSNTRVEVPVQAQIGSGDVTIALELRSPTGVAIGQPQVREVHVRADWEGIGIVVLTVLAVGFVLVGVIRTILRRRARRTDAATEAAEPAPETEAAEPAHEPEAAEPAHEPEEADR